MNLSYLENLRQILVQQEIRINEQNYQVTTIDSLASCLYERLLFLQNKKKCHKYEPYSDKKFQYHYLDAQQTKQESFSLYWNGIPYIRMKRTSKISSQIRDQILSHFKEESHRANKENSYIKLIAYLLYDIFFINHISFPVQEEINITSIDTLYYILSQCSQQDCILSPTDTWDTIYENKEKLCYYLFGIHSKHTLSHIHQVLSEWKGLAIASIAIHDISQLYDIAKEIIDSASIQPMYEYLMREDPLIHREDVREILKHMIKWKKDRTIQSEPPVKSITEWILKLVQHIASTKLYTPTDFLYLIGLLAHKAKDEPNYYLTNQQIQEIREKEFFNISDTLWETFYIPILNDFKESSLASHHIKDGYKFKIKPFRLILAGIYDAKLVNEKKGNPIHLIETYFPTDSKQEKVRLQTDFNKKNDSYCFYGLSLLYHLDSSIRNDCLDDICKKSSNFSVSYREKQICYLYLLTTVLASELPLTFTQRKNIFRYCYGKTMYRFQALFIPYLRRNSMYYELCVEHTIQEACTIETITNPSIFTEGDRQPYYFFLYGILNENYNIKKHKPFQEPDAFLKFSAAIQCRTWYPISKSTSITLNDLIEAIHHGFSEGLWHMISNKNTTDTSNPYNTIKLSSPLMKYVYGVQFLGYAIANLTTYHNINTSLLFTSKKEKETIFKALLYSDYYMRKANPLYPSNIHAGCLLCGTYRAICAIDFNLNVSLFTKSGNQSSIIPAYKEWLKVEWSNNATKRYAYLMAKLLKNIAFITISIKLVDDILNSDISTINFLPYDNVEK